MNGERSALLLSVHPRYAEAILCGTKTVELRRRAPHSHVGTTVVLYATGPVMAIVGSATLGEVVSDNPQGLWPEVSRSAGVDRAAFDTYFEGSTVAYGLTLRSPRRLSQPISLGQMRAAGIEPPQSYRFLDQEQTLGFIGQTKKEPTLNSSRAPVSISWLRGIGSKFLILSALADLAGWWSLNDSRRPGHTRKQSR